MSTIQPREYPSTILAKDSQDNAEATASVTPTNSNQKVYITGVDASYTTLDTVALLQIKEGNTVIWENYVHTSAFVSFPSPLTGAYGASMSAVLAASGTGSNIGKVNLRGYLI
jgi:hypothetical protein